MKKAIFLVALCAALFSSCSQLQTGEGNSKTVINVSGAQVLARAALPSTSSSVYGISLTMAAGENTETRQANGSLAELKAKTFKFEGVLADTEIKVSCTVKYCPDTAFEQTIFSGESAPITVAAGENNIAIAMKKMFDSLGAFDNLYFVGQVNNYNTITEYAIPYGYTTVGRGSIAGQIISPNPDYSPALKKIIIPESVTKIADSAFYCFINLESIVIPESVTEIGERAFSNCSYVEYDTIIGITSITIPKSVTKIGSGAFLSCSTLTSITIECETPPTLGDGDYPFDMGGSLKIYVPKGCKAKYSAAGGKWSDFISLVEEY